MKQKETYNVERLLKGFLWMNVMGYNSLEEAEAEYKELNRFPMEGVTYRIRHIIEVSQIIKVSD